MKLPDRTRWGRVVCLSILVASSVLALLFFAVEIRDLRSPYQRDYGEGHVLWLTMRMLDSGKAYQPLDNPPYVVCPYTPLFMLTTGLVHMLGINLLTAGRALSLFSTLGVGVALAFIVVKVTPGRAPLLQRVAGAAFTGVLPLLMDDVLGWASLMRVDMLALFLMYAGVGVYLSAGGREVCLHLSGVLFVLAIFTKQTMISGPLACLAVGLLVDPRRTLRVCASAGLLLVAGVACAAAVTHGGFLTHILTYNRNPFSWKVAGVAVYSHARGSWPWLAAAAAAVFAAWNPRVIRRQGWWRFLEIRLTNLYGRAVGVAALNCAFAAVLMVTIGKMGASYNHLLAWDISTCLLCGLLLCRILASWAIRPNVGRAAAWACALLLFGLLLPPASLVVKALHSLDSPDRLPADEEVLEIVRRTPGPVFSENLLLPIQAGRPVLAEPATLTFLTLDGRWNERPYVSLFERQYFGLLVAYDIEFGERYSPALTSAIKGAYVLRQRIGPYSLYYPRDHAEFR